VFLLDKFDVSIFHNVFLLDKFDVSIFHNVFFSKEMSIDGRRKYVLNEKFKAAIAGGLF